MARDDPFSLVSFAVSLGQATSNIVDYGYIDPSDTVAH